ncbi:MAG TPA: ferrous iron transport protein B [Verrucomicrobiae bacterium]|nr:ferrous iron transport protein B [Verrucomicrobiae bacterium]
MNSAAAKHDSVESKNHTGTYVVLTGNPNCGKTTLFNALTGLRAKVGNYAGVTVERKEGKLLDAPAHADIRVLDLPGTYSLSPQSLDEQVSRDVLLGRLDELPAPAAIVVVVDASNLQRNLYYATQVIELGYPTVVALNMIDVAETNGQRIEASQLAQALGTPVVPVIASTGHGITALRETILSALAKNAANASGTTADVRFCALPREFANEVAEISRVLSTAFPGRRSQAHAEALLILSNEKALASSANHYPPEVLDAVEASRGRLEKAAIDWRSQAIEGRYAAVSEIQMAVTAELAPPGETFSDKLDRVLTHKVWGTVIFVAIMAAMFQSIFTFASIPMDALQSVVDWLGTRVGELIPEGDLNSLLVDGVIAGVGAVVVFLPQILLLFLFIGFLEDTGYMARAAFLMDRLMSKVGLHGKSFIPMLSSFACAIPGIMATRTIESQKDRLVTILVAPLMSCSARLPVYTLLIGACIPDRVVANLRYDVNVGFGSFNLFGFLGMQGLTMLSMYLLGIVVALFMAWIFKKTLLKGETPLLIMELPPYKRPLLRIVLRHMWDRSKIFLRRAGTVILGINIILWFLATYPRVNSHALNIPRAAAEAPERGSEMQVPDVSGTIQGEVAGEQLRNSFAGRMGRAIEPLIAPLGFDWKIGIGLVASFAAREVFVSTMSTVYNVADAEGGETKLEETLRQQKRPDGTPVYTTLTAVTLMVFYVFALQCVSTVAVVRRETNSWKWPVFQWIYMGLLAWGFAFATLHLGRMLGFE